MGLGQAITSAISGLNVTQSALSIVSGNIANAQTAGYTEKTATQVAAISAGDTVGVNISSVNREIDTYLQAQLRTESSGGNYSSTLSDYYNQLQSVFGQPGSTNDLTTAYNNLTTAAQALSTSPDSSSAQYGMLSAGQSLAQQLNSMSSSIQGLRTQAESDIGNAVTQANQDMQQIATLNQQLSVMNTQDATFATLADQRDSAISSLSNLMNVTVTPTANNEVNVFTGSGVQLVGNTAVKLNFDGQGSLTPQSQWSADPSKCTVGTITIDNGTRGAPFDLLANGCIKSGQIAALVQMRDQVLPQAQAQLDQVAAGLSSALSDQTVSGTAVSTAGQNGYNIDLSTLQSAGDTVNISYTDNSTGATKNLTIMRVDDPSALPLSQSAASSSSGTIVGVDFSNGMASVMTQIQNALGSSGVQFYNPSGTTLSVLDDGASHTVTVNAVSSTTTPTSLQSGSAQLPFFLDGNTPYSGAVTSLGEESTGLSGRIQINPALTANPQDLVAYSASTDAADPTRPNFILNQLTTATQTFSPRAGVGTASSPFTGTISSYMQQVLSQQGQDASNATNLNTGQQQVVSSLQQKYNSESGVNIDSEMAELLQLQNTYSANARVLTTIQSMMQTLLQM
jgi:flagellar hook-associated protein 1